MNHCLSTFHFEQHCYHLHKCPQDTISTGMHLKTNWLQQLEWSTCWFSMSLQMTIRPTTLSWFQFVPCLQIMIEIVVGLSLELRMSLCDGQNSPLDFNAELDHVSGYTHGWQVWKGWHVTMESYKKVGTVTCDLTPSKLQSSASCARVATPCSRVSGVVMSVKCWSTTQPVCPRTVDHDSHKDTLHDVQGKVMAHFILHFSVGVDLRQLICTSVSQHLGTEQNFSPGKNLMSVYGQRNLLLQVLYKHRTKRMPAPKYLFMI